MDDDKRHGGAPEAPAGTGSGWRQAILLGLPALLVVAGALLVAELEKEVPPQEGGVIVIDKAQAEIIAAGERHLEQVRLPYHWDSNHRGKRGSAVFAVEFELADTPVEPWAMHLPKIGNAYEVSLNGARLDGCGELERHDGSDCSLLPRHLPLGAGLVAGTNRLTIAIRADRGRDAGLSMIVVGPAWKIRDDAERRHNWLVVSTTTVAAFSLAIGLLSLGLWRSRLTALDDALRSDQRLYLYAAVAELTHAVTVAASLVESTPLPWPLWGALGHTMLAASICATILFCVETARWGGSVRARLLQGWLAVLVLACPALIHAALSGASTWTQPLWYSALGVTVAGFAALFVARSIRGATLEHRLVAIAIVVNVAAGFHDFYVAHRVGEYLHVTMLAYASLLFDLVLAAIVILRFRAANEKVDELMRSLASRVAQRERELEQSYRQLEQLARRQERMAERSTILRDMHDGVGAHLSMALRQVESGHLSKADLVPPLRDALDQLKLTIDNVSLPAGDVASLMANLRYRLGPRIESAGIRLRWDVGPLEPVERLDAQAMRQLMFVLFEAISNVLQHSKASELRVEAGESGEGVLVRVVDNGVGFDVASSWERGLLTLKSRAERIGAHLEIHSAPGESRVELTIPRR